MQDKQDHEGRIPRRFAFLRLPLFRLLAINLAAGITLAALLVVGLLLLNPFNLRHLILADASPGTALGLLLFGFVVTLGSTAMGTAIMAMGQPAADHGAPRGPRRLVAQPSRARTRPSRWFGTINPEYPRTCPHSPRKRTSGLAFNTSALE